MTFLLTWLPSLAAALTMEGLVAVLDDKQREKVDEIPLDLHPWMLQLIEPALALENADNKYFSIDEMIQFFYMRDLFTAHKAIDEFDYAGIPLSLATQEKIFDFAVAQEIEFERQILEMQMSTEKLDAELARMREENSVLFATLQELRAEETELRAEETELRAEETELRAEETELRAEAERSQAKIAELNKEIVRINRLIASTNEIIIQLESR